MTQEDLQSVLDTLQELPLEGGKGRQSIIDWDKAVKSMVKRTWFKIGDIEKEIQKTLPEGKKVYYSQVMGKLQRLAKKTEYSVRKVNHPTEGIYYRVDRV